MGGPWVPLAKASASAPAGSPPALDLGAERDLGGGEGLVIAAVLVAALVYLARKYGLFGRRSAGRPGCAGCASAGGCAAVGAEESGAGSGSGAGCCASGPPDRSPG